MLKKANINFIYSVDRIMDFNRAEPTCYRTYFPYPSQARFYKISLFTHNTTLYIHPRLDSRIGPRFSDCSSHITSAVVRSKATTVLFSANCGMLLLLCVALGQGLLFFFRNGF